MATWTVKSSPTGAWMPTGSAMAILTKVQMGIERTIALSMRA